jgi:urease accessory protein
MSPPRTTHTRIITTETACGTSAAPQLLRLLHLASPALPIGAFHFSQGLEYAVEARWVGDESAALEWIAGLAAGSLATLDLPVLQRLLSAWSQDDHAAVLRWNALLIASRETEELRLEDRHLGSALFRVLAELELSSELFPVRAARGTTGIAHATAFAFACARWAINAEAALQTYAWAWAENQVLAAVKLVPLGQSAGQRILHALNPRLAVACSRALACADSDIGVCTALGGLASARHETQYTRLFRS